MAMMHLNCAVCNLDTTTQHNTQLIYIDRRHYCWDWHWHWYCAARDDGCIHVYAISRANEAPEASSDPGVQPLPL